MSYQILSGNNIDLLKTLPDNSIDAIVTDPPYGLSKQPDMVEVFTQWMQTGEYTHKSKGFMGKDWDAFVPSPNLWKECFRVLKPGGHILAFYGTRTYDLGVLAMRIAGFEVRNQLAWVYGSGFPKSNNVGKAVDALIKTGKSKPKALREARMGENYEPTGQVDYKKGRMFSSEIQNDTTIHEISNPWEGWGTDLKPAQEPIVLARKPFKGSVAENVLEHGTGGINIDGCRVGDEVIEINGQGNENLFNGNFSGKKDNPEKQGRFPANFIHDGSDEVVRHFPHTKSGKMTSKHKRTTDGSPNGIYGKFDVNHPLSETYGDEGSAARFFYVPKASKKDKNEGLDDFEDKLQSGAEFRPNHMEKALSGEDGNPYGRWSPTKNTHPTVKPTDLMCYLIRMITPPGGVVLDPFMGSGSTGKAAMLEGVQFIGMELDPEYCAIAKARIEFVLK